MVAFDGIKRHHDLFLVHFVSHLHLCVFFMLQFLLCLFMCSTSRFFIFLCFTLLSVPSCSELMNCSKFSSLALFGVAGCCA